MYIEKVDQLARTATVTNAHEVVDEIVKFVRATAPADANRNRQWAAQDFADALDEVGVALAIKDALYMFKQKLQIGLNFKIEFRNLLGPVKRQYETLRDLDREAK